MEDLKMEDWKMKIGKMKWSMSQKTNIE